MWWFELTLPAKIDAAEAQVPEPVKPAPVILEHPPTPETNTTLGGAMSIHAPWSLEPGINLIKEFEGFVGTAYPDPLSGGEPWTIGYGSTYVKGKKVQRGDKISQAEATAELKVELGKVAERLEDRIPYWAEMNAAQRGALLSFAWNLGTNFYGSPGFAAITHVLKNRLWKDVPNALKLYRNPGSNVEHGLLRRRVAEGTLWLSGLQD